jgi:hypothetical protein
MALDQREKGLTDPTALFTTRVQVRDKTPRGYYARKKVLRAWR